MAGDGRKLACGYGHTERTKRFRAVDKAVRKEVPPNTKAQIFWLSNRAPGRWQRKAEAQRELGRDLVERLAEAKERVRMGTGP